MSEHAFVGIDVAKAVLDVAVRPTGETWQVANDESRIGELVDRTTCCKASRESGRS
jgi:transposase